MTIKGENFRDIFRTAIGSTNVISTFPDSYHQALPASKETSKMSTAHTSAAAGSSDPQGCPHPPVPSPVGLPSNTASAGSLSPRSTELPSGQIPSGLPSAHLAPRQPGGSTCRPHSTAHTFMQEGLWDLPVLLPEMPFHSIFHQPKDLHSPA